MKTRVRYSSRLIAIILLMGILNGCSHYRLHSLNSQAGSPMYESKVVWSCFWGLVEHPVTAPCQAANLAEVKVESNLGFKLITALTLGAAVPVRLKWKCAAPAPEGGTLGAPPDSSDPESRHEPR